VRRYGFHGLSYAFLLRQLAAAAGRTAARGRIILAHLGNGASLAAVHRGRPIDTSMGFTPAGGVPMGTRAGDLDPGLAWFIMQTDHLDARQWNKMVNSQSGLLGISETTSDMRELLQRAEQDVRAAEAVAIFCYQVRKWIGAFAAALNGLDTLVFSGGIGEKAAPVRARICHGLQVLGIELEPRANRGGAAIISKPGARVTVRVMATDEELMIAELACGVLGIKTQSATP
jgi:acetate kinase